MHGAASSFPTPADATDIAALAFWTAIHEMEAGDRPLDVEYLIRLAEFVFDAHAHAHADPHPRSHSGFARAAAEAPGLRE
jgi:hypothetical protein